MMQIIASNQSDVIVRDMPQGDGEVTIGRHSECDLIISGAGISRRHARLLFLNGSVFIEDTGSSAGTFLNGSKITEMMPLDEGAVVQIGEYSITIGDPDQVKAPAPQQGHVKAEVVEKEVPAPAPAPPPPPPSPQSNVNFLDEFRNATVLYENSIMALKKRIHEDLLEKMNLSENAAQDVKTPEALQNVERQLDQVLKERRHEIPSHIPLPLFRQAVLDEVIGFGPITPMIRSNNISEIMINGPDRIFVESSGKIYESGVRFFNEQHLISIIQRIVEPLGRHVDEASPMVDARLPDGSRVNAIIPPLSLRGASVTIRKFSEKKLTTDDLIKFGSMTREMALFLEEAVRSRQNILVSGGTGSGKTTLLNVLSLFIPQGERVITVEDSAELKLTHPNLVSLEARPANIEGKGRITIRDLVINTLRMRPDRIIVGECRGPEALDMLQAMNTGHDGSLTTVHANNPRDALTRLENMVMMAGFELPSKAIREQIASALDLIVQQTRLPDGSRKIVQISEVTGREGDVILLQDIFTFEQEGLDKNGKVIGHHTATGNIPYFVDELRKSGRLRLDMGVFVPKN
ncbi:MAG: Flp pilus assembly complex ATPase component TadA [Lentisphaerae bacterium]|jgi:pilus assembly protein CpaF|nr:Flp pilus assembly complex ATPase component TadA [Lentisphaerota bacterium]